MLSTVGRLCFDELTLRFEFALQFLQITSSNRLIIDGILGIRLTASGTEAIFVGTESVPAESTNLERKSMKEYSSETNLILTVAWIEIQLVVIKRFHAQRALKI
jgi:hypothetical protein